MSVSGKKKKKTKKKASCVVVLSRGQRRADMLCIVTYLWKITGRTHKPLFTACASWEGVWGADIRSTVLPKYPLVFTTRSIRLFLRLNWEKVGKGREGHQDHDEVHRPEGSGGMSMTVHREGHLAFPKPGGSQNPGLPPSLGSPEIQFLFCMAKMEGVSSPCIERLCLVAGSACVCTCARVRAHMCLYVHTEGKLNVF